MADKTVVQPRRGDALSSLAPHVREAIQLRLARSVGAGAPAGAESSKTAASRALDFVTYGDKKSSGSHPPPPRWPVYQLSFDDRGRNCRLLDLQTGRTRAADSLYAGFVRMGKNGGIYVSPRPSVGLQGDSHPTIASRSPEWMAGQRSIVAGGEVGILGGEVVGHNDKTGHFQTRHNRSQSGMPSDRFFPYTIDPRSWYRSG